MVFDWIREQAASHPRQIAVTQSGCHLSYGKLESQSNRLAGLLRIAGVKAGGKIGLLMEKSPGYIVALHGVAKAGCVSVPLNRNQPPEYLLGVIKDADVSVLIVDGKANPVYLALAKKSEHVLQLPWIWWSTDFCVPKGQKRFIFCQADVDEHPDYPYQKVTDVNAPAVLMYKKTPSGRVKKGTISHKNIQEFTDWTRSHFNVCNHDRIAAFEPFYTEPALFDMFTAFSAGAHLYLPEVHKALNTENISDFILENDITQLAAYPVVFKLLHHANAIPEGGYPGLKRTICYGNGISNLVIRYWMGKNPAMRLSTIFGLPETGERCCHTFRRIPEPEAVNRGGYTKLSAAAANSVRDEVFVSL